MSNTITQDLLKSLETSYAKGEFNLAVDLMLKNKDQFEPGLFHYNLGTLYLKLDKPAVARFHFEKALRKGFENDLVHNNLTFAKQEITAESLEKGEDWLIDGFNQFLFSPMQYAIIWVLLIFLSLNLFWSKIKLWKWYATLGLVLLLAIPVLFQIYFKEANLQAITLQSTVSKEGPSQIFETNHEIPAGVKLIISEPQNGWYFIRYPKHYSGWITAKDLGII